MLFGRRRSSAEAVLRDGECGEQAARLVRGLGGRAWAPRCTCTWFLFFFPLSVGQLPLVVRQGQRRSMLLLAVPTDFISKPFSVAHLPLVPGECWTQKAASLLFLFSTLIMRSAVILRDEPRIVCLFFVCFFVCLFLKPLFATIMITRGGAAAERRPSAPGEVRVVWGLSARA